jgi:alkaline phosphatase
VNNGVINISPEGRQQVPILVQARQNGKMTGLVTTTRVTHATPASFIANAPMRDLWKVIAPQILEREVDVVLGGGSAHFADSLLAKHPAVSVARDREQLLSAKPEGRLLGVFAKSHVPMVLERGKNDPSLVDMTNAALARLDRGPHGFVLQVEGGRVDHAARNNDAASLIAEQLEFDDTIGAVLRFLDGRSDTLLVITTDHANANPGLTLYGKPGKDAFDRISRVKHSFDWVWEEVEKRPGETRASAAAEIAEAATGIALDQPARELLARALMKKRVAPFAGANVWTSVLGALLADHLGVAFTGPNHTSDMVEVTAMGPGSELIPPAIDNIDLHKVMVDAMSLKPATLLPGMDMLIEPAKGVNDD